MKQTLRNWVAALLLAAPMSVAFAAGGHAHYEKVDIDLGDQVSLQRGAQIFTNYCLSCHSASGMRFNRLQDLGLTEDEIKKNLMFTTDKVGDVMQSAMAPADAKKWFGAEPPDLTLIARSRGADYLYAYMRGFYKDPTRPTGWNNTVFDKVGMPHPLWEQQGVKAVELDAKGQPVMVKDEHGNMVPKLIWESTGLHSRRLPNGKVIEKEYDSYVRDLVNYLVYMGEPAQLERKRTGYIILIFLLAVMLPLAYFLKKEYWKDIH
ncbi:protein PetC [Neisseria animaloris]|uniref:Protein PetC n=1 Tax=Neisseria animaloris TaxID=326522 RepID=A0A448UEQ6_9NEIS|nr:cytochrome c1 [Neisseria animaloris]MDO5072898.1 cytochrome c1 [Neisseria animaloris]VEH87547.1 protein PetC [Neisseria animaloris]VEJ22354.1 protein PetC [Neisseria animaloris]